MNPRQTEPHLHLPGEHVDTFAAKHSKDINDIIKQAKLIYGMRSLPRGPARLRKMNQELETLAKKMEAFRAKMKKQHMTAFLDMCLADPNQEPLLQQMLDECIICEEITKEESDIAKQGKDPWLDEISNIVGDIMHQNMEQRAVQSSAMARAFSDPMNKNPVAMRTKRKRPDILD